MNKDTVWAGFFGLVYCKFFWDFVNGTLRNPGGIQRVLQTSLSYAVPESPFILIRVPRLAKQDAFFIDIIVKAPVIPIISMILGFVIVALKYPAPFMKGLVLRHAVTRGLRVLREQLFLRLLLTTCRASEYTLDLESCLGMLRQS
jgi:hypothetical protein